MGERRTFCPEDGHPCYTPEGPEPEGFKCANYSLCQSFETPVNPPEQPSEAMIEAGVETYLKPPGGQARSHAELCRQIYLAMQRAATPAPVQDDDAKFLRNLADDCEHGIEPGRRQWERLRQIAARLSTDTALVEAVRVFLREGTRVTQRGGVFLTQVIERKDKSDPYYKLCEALEAHDAALAARGGDNGK